MKKRMTALVLAMVLMVTSLTGCGNEKTTENDKETGKTSEAVQETSGQHVDVLRIGTTYPNDAFNLFTSDGAYGRMNYNAFVGLNFWAFDENGQLSSEGCFFRDWEIGEDDTQLRLSFDTTDLYWHDDVAVTGEDVIFTFEYYKKQNYPLFLHMTEIQLIDEQTMQVTFDRPMAFAFMNQATLMYKILPKHIWENVENPETYDGEDAAVGCGPYRLASVDEYAQVSYYEAVENYPLGEQTIDKVEIHSYDNQSALMMAMTRDEIDVMYGYSASLDTTLLGMIDGNNDIDAGESVNTATYQIMFGFNNQPTDDLNFRMAVRYALDYDLFNQFLSGGYGEAANQGAVSPAALGYDDTLEKNARDLEKSNQYLDDGGYKDVDGDGYRELPDGSPMNVSIALQNGKNEVYKRIAEMIQIHLNDVGIRTTIDQQTISNADYATKLRMDGTYEIYIGMTTVGIASWTGIASYLADVTITSGQHFGTYDDAEYIEAYNEMEASRTYDEYTTAFKKIQEMNVTDCPGIALAITKTFYPYRTDRMTGWTNYPAWGVIHAKTWYQVTLK